MHESAEDTCALLSSKLKPVTFKHDLPSTGPLRGTKPRMKGDAEYTNRISLLEKS
jgi:hypothetical protein